MKHYRLTQNAFIGGVFYKSGETAPSDDEPGPHMIRVVTEEEKATKKAEAEAAKKAAEGVQA